MKKYLLSAIVAILVFTGCEPMEKEIRISKSTIQKITENYFPIEKSYTLATVKLSSPQVFFVNDSIGLNIQYSAYLLVKEVGGTVSFTCRPVYKPENTSFYMADFKLTNITLNSVDSFIGKDKLMELISAIVNTLFKDKPLYQLNPGDYKQNIAKMLLKSVGVSGDNLVLLLSL
jgi:hypothetical protein